MWLRSAIVALAAAHAASAEEFSGDMTAYTLGQPSSGNCNFMSSAPQASVNYAALNTPQWAGTKNCGRCALVSCVDSRCSDHSKTELVYILDRCPECQYGDLDVSPSVFKSLTGSDPSRYKIKWSFVDCPVTGNIKYCLKGGSNPFWTAIQPANTVTGVASMAINSKATGMVDSAYYYLLNGQSTTQTDLSAVQITLTSVSGEVIRDTVSLSAGSCTDGAHQFSRGTAPNPAPAPAPAPVTPPATPKSTPAPVPTTKAPVSTTTTPGSTTTTPSATQSTSNNSTVAGDADNTDSSQDDAPGKVKAPDATGSSDTQTSEDRTGTDESGELTDTASPSTTPATSSGGSGATETNTRSQTTSKTSPALVVLASLAAVGMVALAIVAVVVKRKRLMDKEADRDDSLMIVNLRSFDTMTTPANVPGAHQQQQRTDFAVL